MQSLNALAGILFFEHYNVKIADVKVADLSLNALAGILFFELPALWIILYVVGLNALAGILFFELNPGQIFENFSHLSPMIAVKHKFGKHVFPTAGEKFGLR